jgi:6-pyruvoyltetrahydropterin/6-carboxytetrahydropterin synthase
MKIAKEFRWEMGHRLPEHFGQCKNIHGHSYKMIVEFDGDLDKQGMVLDYYDVEKIIDPIIKKLDHSFMVYKNDTVVIEFLEKVKSKKIVVDFESTAENISKYMLGEISKSKLPSNVKKLTVCIYETEGDYAKEEKNL